MRQAILDHFGGDFTGFYGRYLPDLKHGKANCPFHDCDSRSLSADTKTGFFNCHFPGCGAHGDIFKFYALKRGLNGDFPAVLQGIASDFGISAEKKPTGRIVKAYDYTDPDGKLLFQVCRMEPKDFRQRRPDGKGGFIWDTKGVERVLYRLPAVLNADEVWITEGEKDADNLAALGFTATTNAGGAEAWRPEYADTLKGKHVYYCGDQDEAGEKHAAKVLPSIYGKAALIRVIELPLGVKDVSDFIKAQPDPDTAAERLSIMAKGAAEWTPPAEAEQATGNPPEKIQLVTLEDVYQAEIQDTPIIEGFHYEDESLIIHADGGFGKSLISQDIAMHLGAGAERIWSLYTIPRDRISLFVQSENSRKALQARARKKVFGNPDLLCGVGNVFYCGFNGAVQIAGAMVDEKFRKYLIDYAKAVEDSTGEKIGNIVFDPLISYADGDENDNAVMRHTLDLITETSGIISATPTVLHHSNKMNGLRGASAIQNWARSIIKLERVGAESDRRIMVINTKNNNHEYFKPFVLELDDNLNFRHREQTEILSPKKLQKCQAVAEALRKMGGRAETQDALIEQYREDTKLKSASAAQEHLNLAERFGFILAEEYRDGKLIKKRYLMASEKKGFETGNPPEND